MVTNRLKWKWLIPLLLFSTIMAASSKLMVTSLDGSEQQFALSQIGKIQFTDDVMYLYDHNNTLLGSNPINQVGHIEITQDSETAIDAVSGQVLVRVNTAEQQITVSGLADNQMLRVFDINGRMICTVPSQADQTLIDVSGLTNGTYLLQFGAQVVKFVK